MDDVLDNAIWDTDRNLIEIDSEIMKQKLILWTVDPARNRGGIGLISKNKPCC